MPSAASFSVKPQPAQENQNPNALSTQPTFFVSGSKAATQQSKRKKKTIAPLVPTVDYNRIPQGTAYPSNLMDHGFPTPETPTFGDIQANLDLPAPLHPYGFIPPIAQDRFSFTAQPYYANADQMMGANLLFAPQARPFFPPLGNQYSNFSAPDLEWASYSDAPEMPETAYMDVDEPELSPLILQPQATLPPESVPRNELQVGLDSPRLQLKPRKKYTPKSVTINLVEKTLQEASLTPTTFLIRILEEAEQDAAGDSMHALPGKAFFRSTNEPNIQRLLNLIFANKKGRAIIEDWMKSHALTLVCKTIATEMETAKPLLRMSTSETTPEFIETWDINKVMDPIAKDVTPYWSAVLSAATESKAHRAKAEESVPFARCRKTTRNIISAQVHYQRSCKSAKVQVGLGLMAYMTGASRNLMNVLHKAGLSMSYCSIGNIITSLADFSVQQAAKFSHGPHAIGYDNINQSTSQHVEQRPDGPAKFASGTFTTIYPLPNVDSNDLKLAPMIERLKKAKHLVLGDLRPTRTEAKWYSFQSTINITKILFKHSDLFQSLKDSPALQHHARHAIPPGEKTCFYPIAVSTIEEATVNGNIAVHNNIYMEQLGHGPTSEYLNQHAVPCLNDQLTNSRIRSVQALRVKDTNPWERREIFQLAFGTFHLVMNLLWAILHTHRGSVSEHGSLSHYFSLLEKSRLGSDRPDYHTLLMTLTQILEGLIFNAWRKECGHDTLEAFAKSNPTSDDILRIAKVIIDKYATPDADQTTETEIPSKRKADGNKSPGDTEPTVPPVDHVHKNTVLLTRDLLYVAELVNAMSTGDFGRIEDVLPQIACMFRGAGSNNYSMEILHLLFNLRRVWTPKFADIMRDIMLVNPSGLDGHCMAIDMNIEHLIGYIKGLYSSWDRLGNISAAVNYLQLIKKRVVTSLQSGYQGATHKTPDTSMLVMRVANRARELKLQEHIDNRELQSKPRPDIHAVGYRKFETASLSAFNKKIDDYRCGKDFEGDEVDELEAVTFSATEESEETPESLVVEEIE